MSRTHVELIATGIVTALSFAGCASPDHTSTTDGGNVGPVVDAMPAPPFTSGVSTLAGAGDTGSADGDRDVARFSNPVNVAYGPDGMLYVADFDNGLVRAVDKSGNVTTVVAQMGFQRPFGLAFAPDGSLFTSTDNDDTGAHDAMSGTVWKIDLTAKTATVVARRIGRPRGLAVMASGMLALADDENDVIETLDPTTGTVATIAGTWDVAGFADATGAAARFSSPYGLAALADGTLAVSDYGNNRIRIVTLAGVATTLAGTGTAGFVDGSVAAAAFSAPEAIAIDSSGTLYVNDTNNYRVRRIRSGMVDTIVDNGTGGYVDSNSLLSAEMYGLEGVSVATDGSMIYVADGNRGNPVPYNRVREVNMTQ